MQNAINKIEFKATDFAKFAIEFVDVVAIEIVGEDPNGQPFEETFDLVDEAAALSQRLADLGLTQPQASMTVAYFTAMSTE